MTMRRLFVLFIIILVNFALQSALFPFFAIMEVIPDTALVLIISYAILRGDIEGALFGIAVGFVQDISGGAVIGVFALLGFLTGYICGKPFSSFFKDNYFLPFFVVLFVCFVYQTVLYAATLLLFRQLDFSFYLRSIILPKTIYTASLAVPLYACFYYLNSKLEAREEPKDEL